MSGPYLSVVLPCYRAAPVAVRTIDVLSGYLDSAVPSWEIIVVDDGGDDFPPGFPEREAIQLISHPHNLGKGAAVRTGMLAATGQVRVFTDVDMPYDRELVPLMADYITRSGFHLVIGDRRLPGSRYAEATTLSRRVLSSVASQVVGSLVTGGFFDTQCGIKALRGDIADALFRMVRTPRFAFDIEVVYLALKHGLDVKRVPVRLRRNLSSSVRPVRDAARSAIDILLIKQRQMSGAYRSEQLERILRAETDAAFARVAMPR
jgi:dolichyl-phosphate beta-glucosyltransferase